MYVKYLLIHFDEEISYGFVTCGPLSFEPDPNYGKWRVSESQWMIPGTVSPND